MADQLRTQRGRQFACADAGFDVAPDAGDAFVGGQAGENRVLHHRPHPVDLLAGATPVELARIPQHPVVLEHRVPELVDAGVLDRAHRAYRRCPQRVVRVDQAERVLELAGGGLGIGFLGDILFHC